MHQQLLYTIAQCCRMAAIGRTKFYELIANGEIPVRKVGKKTLVAASDLRDEVRSQFERGNRAVLSNLLCRDLIHRRRQHVIAAFGPLRERRAEERRVRRRVIARRVRHLEFGIRQDRYLIEERHKR